MIEKWQLTQISNMLTHHRIIASSNGTKFKKKFKLKFYKKIRIPEELNANLKQTRREAT